jgi:hypothetical protein
MMPQLKYVAGYMSPGYGLMKRNIARALWAILTSEFMVKFTSR